jgi:uncharacterized protein (TIGR02594 family)
MIFLSPKKLIQLPVKWAWLLHEDQSEIISEALKHYGTLEIVGKDNNPDILQWAKEVGVEKDYSNDEIPWCGLFVAIVIKRTGGQVVSKPLWARNWLFYGKETKVPMLGDIMVFKRGAGGHVAFYVGETGDAYAVLGGNQSNSVSITFIAKDRLLGARRKNYDEQPAYVRTIHLKQSGELSTNEA